MPTPQPNRSGRRRRVYRQDAVPLAAVLLRLSDLGLETNLLKSISVDLQIDSKGRGRFARFWKAALQGSRSTAYISFYLEAGRAIHRYDWQEFGLRSWESILADEPQIFLDLVAVFAEVRDAAAE
jgi:hypothetical protein